MVTLLEVRGKKRCLKPTALQDEVLVWRLHDILKELNRKGKPQVQQEVSLV